MDILNAIVFFGFWPVAFIIAAGIMHEEKLIKWEKKQRTRMKKFFKKLLKNA